MVGTRLFSWNTMAMPRWRASSGVRGAASTPSTSILPEVERDDAGHHFCQRRFAGAVLADQRMDLAAAQLEIDVLDRGHAGIELGRLAKREDDVVAHARNSCSIPASGSRSSRPGPLAMANSAPSISTAATTP